ncbi:hypothetical protein BHM03_00057664 [Ensete ventricosum]|nr:hypothetical protein BHM03_00057664 [Ensete ventricosum]
MSQEHPFGSSGAEHRSEPNHSADGGGHHSSADSEPFLENDDRPGVSLTRVQPCSGPCRKNTQVMEAHAASSTVVPARSQSCSCDLVQTSLDLDTLSSDTADSLREQVRQVHQRLDDVQKEVLKSRGEIGETSKGDSPFTPEI